MRRLQRVVSASVLIALSGALAGCGSMSNWDPMDMLDFLDTKKKLPGERKPVFPEGVPGLQQGVPKELYKGNAHNTAAAAAGRRGRCAAPPPTEPKSAKRGAKSKAGKPTAVSAAPAQEPARAGSRCGRSRRRRQHRRGTSGAETQENGPAAHHVLAER